MKTPKNNVTAAVYYHPEGYTTKGPKLMGRHVAGESFLKGLVEYGRAPAFHALVDQSKHGEDFIRTVREAGRSEPVQVIDKGRLEQLSTVGNVFYPGPNLARYAWQRSFAGHDRWSLCGITHTTSSAGAMDAITDMLVAPVQPWDALICTSDAVHRNVLSLLEEQQVYLQERLGIQRVVLPRLPVIPLGIHAREFEYSEERKERARGEVGADHKTHVVMFMGRLSFHAKAHPLPMYLALQRAAERLPRDEKILLIECGWHANEHIAQAFNNAAAAACPDVRVLTLDGRKPESRDTAWAAADVFCSLSDNIQETFGIVPIEAMAAGLPVVVSDWDGYKDTVRDGIDGFRIASTMPGPGSGVDLAYRHALEIDSYDRYCGYNCTFVAVDVEETAQAFMRLFESPLLREVMGRAGRKRAREVYDWSVIIPRYEELWQELTHSRLSSAAKSPVAPGRWPARSDPFASFANYPTRTLSGNTLVRRADADLDSALLKLERFLSLRMIEFAAPVLPSRETICRLLQLIGIEAKAVEILAREIEPAERESLERGIAWLLKVGLLELVYPQTDDSFNELGNPYKKTLNVVALGLTKRAGVTEARVDYPLEAMNCLSDVRATWSAGAAQFTAALDPGVFILHRQFMTSPEVNRFVERKITQGWVVVADMDDDPRHWKAHVDSRFYAFRAVHAVTVSTDPLASMMRQWNPNVQVFPNAARRLYPPPDGPTRTEGIVRVFFGAINREKDWRPLRDDLNLVFEAFKDRIELVVVHDRAFYEAISDSVSKEFFPTLDPERYMDLLATSDVALLPLEDTSFNRLKSDLKLIECCAASAVPICSAVVYGDKAEHKEVALFVDTPREWGETLRRIIMRPELLTEKREKGYEYVKQGRLHRHQAPLRDLYYRRLMMKRQELELDRQQRLSLHGGGKK